MTERFIRLPEVLDRLGVSKATLYRRIAAGQFPAQVKYGKASLWSEHEVDAWFEAIKGHRKAA